jgi:hypothetical protein
VPLQNGLGGRIGFLQIDAPVSQFLKGNGRPGHGAANERTGPYDAEIAVQVFDFSLSGTRGPTICAIEQGKPPSPMSRSSPPTVSTKIVIRRAENHGAAGVRLARRQSINLNDRA